MAFDLIAAYAQADTPFFLPGQAAQRLTEAPQQITLRFSPGVKIEATSLTSTNIVVQRSGGAADAFGLAGSQTDVTISPGSITVNDLPNQNEVVIRFAETPLDDAYRITIKGGASGIKSMTGDTLAADRSFDFRLDLGAFVISVVPQPVTRAGGTLAQSRNTVDVYFNRNDPLDPASAQQATSYRLFEIDPVTGEDLAPLAPVNPASVSYNATTGRATLTFASDLDEDKLFRLQIGAAAALVAAAAPVAEGSDDNSSFTTARNLGALTAAGASVDGVITRPRAADPTPANQGTLGSPAGNLQFPSQIGTIDEPGHRQETFIPVDSHGHGNAAWTTSPDAGVTVQFYNFQAIYGVDGQGNALTNAITENQKQRAREVFELFSRYTGIRFVESATDGLTVATGDPRALNPLVPPTAVDGIASELPQLAIMNSLVDWGQSEYGGRYFQVAMHEIGHALGLDHSYDIPSIMGAGLTGEPVFPGDYDTIHLAQLYPAINSDVDTYRFTVAEPGTLSAQTVIARPGQAALSTLDSLLTLYREETINGKVVRTLIARNDDSFGRDSFIGLNVQPGTYFIAVTSTGNDAFNPEVSDSGYGGRSAGDYRLELGFQPRSTAATTIVDASGSLFDGDRDGTAGGAFNFWFKTAAFTGDAATNRTLFVDKAAYPNLTAAIAAGADGTIGKPFYRIQDAIAAALVTNAEDAGNGVDLRTIIRIVGNNQNTPYLVGTTLAGVDLDDGDTFNVPEGVTVMVDAGAMLKLRAAVIDVGSSSPLVGRAGAAFQVLGTPDRNVIFTSYHDDAVGGDSDAVGPAATGGQWGGIVLRQDSDSASKRAFVNSIANASIRYGGGQVLVDSDLASFAPIQLESTRPTIAYNTITDSAGAAIAADPNSFEESNGRVGPEIRGNRMIEVRPDGLNNAPLVHQNSINGLFIKIRTEYGQPLDRLDVPARLRSTDIVYVLQENLLINGGAGGYLENSVTGDVEARQSGRLTIDPGVVVKLQGSRIELDRGVSQLIAEGTATNRVIFTSLGDNRFGAGGTFDTNGNLPDARAAGDWGGIMLNAGAKASIDYAYIAYGGGQTPIEGAFDYFNVIETHQGDLRVAHSRIENNASGIDPAGTTVTNRAGRGGNAAATIFVRGAQPVILDNDVRGNVGAVVSVNANSLSDVERADPGRTTGPIDRDRRYDDNRGPLVRGNRLPFDPVAGSISGMQVRGEEITVESVWDDTDIVHVLQSEIVVQNFHTASGLRLVSRPDASLVVKLLDPDGTGPLVAGFTAAGYQLDIDDRIGGTVQIVGQPGYPVILTSLKDDTVGASIDPLGRFVKDTGNDGNAAPKAGDWRGLKFTQYSNDRNVAIMREVEKSLTGGIDANGLPSVAQQLGTLAPNFATGGNTPESAQEKSGDENRRLGFEVHGRIAADDVTDVDVYSFFGYSGSEVWIDIDKTSDGLDSMLELLDASGVVLARSADAQTDAALLAVTRGLTAPLSKNAAFGGDFYTTNPRDPGMRVTLPSRPGQPTGSLTQYYVRVRSQPRYEPATTGPDNGGVTGTATAAYEADLRDAGKVKAGATNGGYELRIRLRQQDEKPGSTVRYADIRYPTIGIDVQGLPRSSPLVGESGESAAVNDLFGSAQYVGNLLQSDRGTISIAGIMQSATDVDWYTFALNLEQIQSIGGVSDALKSWATVFDIDYGDGLRGDLVISVFNADGQLLYVGRDSNVASDQPGVGQGNDFDDLSRGSLGKLDPFIGSVQLAAGNPTGGGGLESGLPVTASDPSRQLRYYVAVSSNQKLPTVLDAYFNASATNSLVRLEPINSVSRIAEDHIGFDGYLSGPALAPTQVAPQQKKLFDTTDATTLSLHVTPFTLSDVTLFVYTGTTIETVDAMRGGNETILSQVLVPPANAAGDIAMRSDGKLYQYRPGTNAGFLYSVNTVTGATTPVGDDNIPTPPVPTPAPPAPPAEARQTLSPDELGGQTSTFSLANAGLDRATVNGTLRYTDTTGGINGTPVNYSWSFTSNGAGTLTFTNIPTPAPPAGFAAPTSGTVTAGAYVGDTLQNAVATINWSKPIDMTKLQMSVQYSYRTPPVPNPDSIDSNSVDALAFRRVPGLATAHQLYYSVNAGGGRSALYSANATTGNAATTRIGTGTIASAIPGQVGVVTGLAFVADTMYGVDTNGNVFQFSANASNVPQLAVSILHTEAGVRFAGLAAGPANLQNGAFASMVFAITDDGDLYAFDTVTGDPQPVFDSDGDGVADSTSIPTRAVGAWSGVLGLAFSPLDVNLWHPTVRRGRDAGHGINISLDETRNELDNSNFAIDYQSAAPNRKFLPGEGGASMYFGLETYVRPTAANATPYLNYESQDGQLGVRNGQWQQDLTSAADTMIGNNYNLPGGAYGSLITNTFSLANSTYTDKPTLYFNYWLQTENASGAYNQDTMRDSARVFVSDNGGPWQVVASNNSDRSAAYTSKGELPNFVSASSALTTADNQHVQELYDVGTWRQARIDLGKWAGSTNLRLRFDFSTAGEFDSTQLDASGNPVNDIAGYAGTTGDFSGSTRSRERGQNNAFEGFYVDDVIIGYAERGEMVTGITKTSANTNFFDIVTPPAAVVPGYALAEQSLTGPYQLEIRRGTEYGVQPLKFLSDVAVTRTFDTNADLVASKGFLGDANQPREQGQFLIENNTVSDAALYGISIDSVAATTVARLQRPAAGYGRLVQTGFQLQAGNTYRFTARYAGNVQFDPTDHVPQLVPTGPVITRVALEPVARSYEFRDGWTYCEAIFAPQETRTFDLSLGIITLSSVDVTDISLKSVAGQTELVRNGSFEQQLSDWTTSGGTVSLASVVEETRVPIARNLATLNSGRLAPGAVVVNNVIAGAGTAGILFSGDTVAGRGVVPFGRIVNNTIYGGATPQGTGIAVTENAGPTLLNNLFANLAKGVDVDASSQANTVIGGSAYHQVTTQVAGTTQSQQITLTTNPFVNAAARNFYLATKSAAIDSSVNSLVDRPAMVAVTSPLGIAQSPILAPERDRFGQLRGDDPTQASAPGLGSNVFKDRGAIDRVDFTQPSAQLAVPLDNSPSDKNTSPNGVRLEKADARNLTRFEIQLNDVGVGIDRSTVEGAFEFRREGLPLPAADYTLNYLESSNRVVFESTSVYAAGTYEIAVKRTNGGAGTSVITDLAGNPLLPNRANGATSFTIELADVPTVPAGLTATSGNAQMALGWTAATSAGTPLLRYEIEWATSDTFAGATLINVAAPAVAQTVTPLTNGTLYWFRIRAVNAVGPSDWSGGVGPVVPLRVPSMALTADTGTSGDGITKDGRVTIGNLDPGTTWEWSRDGGTNWTTGDGTTFTLPAGSYAAGQVQARQRKASSVGSAATNPIAWTIDMTAPNAPTLALGTGVANGATLAEATQATGVVTVSGEAGATITVTFSRVGGGTVTKTFTGTGAAQPVQLTAADVATLGNGVIDVSATQVDTAGNTQTSPAATTSFTLDTIAPNAPTLVLGTGVANGATQAEATQASGVVRVTAEAGATVTVTFSRVGGGTVTKTFTGTGTAQAVVLTTAEVGTLGNGLITVIAGVADLAGNTSQATTSFTLDTVVPNAPLLALGTGVANGATLVEATQATGVVRVTAETGAAVTVTFSRVGGGTVTKTLTGSGIAQAVVLTAANVTTLGNGLINVSATQVDAAGNAQTDAAATTSFTLDIVVPNAPLLALGTGVVTGATQAEAIQATGVVLVTAETGATVTVTFSRVGGGTVTKTLTGTGEAQAVVLTAADVTTLGNGLINVAATQVDTAGNAQTVVPATTSFTLDTVTPTVTGVTSAVTNGTYGTGQIIPIQVRFSEAVVVAGTPTLALNTTPARSATYASGSGTNTLVFNYVIQLGDAATRLDQRSTTSLELNGGTIRDAAGNDAVRTLAAPGTAGSLGAGKVITVTAVLRATVGGFGTTSPGPAFTTAVTTIPITFNAPVTGFTLASLKLFYQDRPLSLAGATLTGSSANYVLTLPRTTTSLRGRYRLDIGGVGSGIVSGGVPMTTATSIYWQRI